MLAIGMVASFLTGNLTVAFVLGLLFNAPLYGMFQAGNYMTDPGWSAFFKEWSLDGQFRDFARGVVSLPAMIYFLSITALMLYVCMMLIGRRHWLGGRDGHSMLGHYLVRTAALAGVIIGLNWLVSPAPAYVDVTAEQLSALHPDTKDLLAGLDPKRPVKIDAYVSPTVPDEYVEQRANLLSFVREFDRRGGDTLEVRVHEIEPTTDAALLAEQQYDIMPRASGRQGSRRVPRSGNLPGRGRHQRLGESRRAVLRSHSAGRVRAGSLGLHGESGKTQEGRRAANRCGAVRRL